MSARAIVKTRRKTGGLDTFQKAAEKSKRRGGYRVKVGLPKGSGNYPDGTPIIKVGIIHEFGSEDGTIPERSFLRSAVRVNAKKINNLVARLAKSVTSEKGTPEAALEKLGTAVASMIRNQIIAVVDPPNTAATIRAKKGSSNPLVDTGLLGQSITHQVIGKSGK